MSVTDRARRFLDDAHANSHRGPEMLRRWAMARNGSRRTPGERITTAVLDEATALEATEREPVPMAWDTCWDCGVSGAWGFWSDRCIRCGADKP